MKCLTYAKLSLMVRFTMGITRKQKDIYDFISNYIRTNNLAPTQREIKEYFNLQSFGSVSRYLKYLVDASLIKNDKNGRRGIALITKELQSEIELPLIGHVAAGNPIEAICNPTETIEVPSAMISTIGNFFALTVNGDSMIDLGILDQDTVICQQCSNAETGSIIVAMINGETTLKKYQKLSKHINLIPANPRYKPIIVSKNDEFTILGILTGLLRIY